MSSSNLVRPPSHFFGALVLAATLGTGGCALLIPGNGTFPAEHVNAPNPVTGKPAEVHFISEKDDACDALVPHDATRLSIKGDQICVDQRRSLTHELGDPLPQEKTWVTRVKTDTGITDRITRTGKASPVASCEKGTSRFQVWTYEVSGCTPNNGVLTASTQSASLNNVEAINGEGDTFLVFSFAPTPASAAKTP